MLVGAFPGVDLTDAVVVGKAVEVGDGSGRQVLEPFAEQGLHVQVVLFVLFVLQTEENGVVGIQIVINDVLAGLFCDMRHPEFERAKIILQVEQDGVCGEVAGVAQLLEQVGAVQVVHHFLEDFRCLGPVAKGARVVALDYLHRVAGLVVLLIPVGVFFQFFIELPGTGNQQFAKIFPVTGFYGQDVL